jgi:PQQ-dependent dehydrogenase (methanol/ethanol family)
VLAGLFQKGRRRPVAGFLSILVPVALALAACGKKEADQGWTLHGNDAGEQRFSTLTKINTENVGQLGLAWSADVTPRTARVLEGTPIVVGDVMYVTTGWSNVAAIKATTGEILWKFDPKVPGEYAVKACCSVVNRGAAYQDGKLFFGTLDGRLIKLDAKTGAKEWEVLTVDQTKDYTITGAPRIVKDKVIIGNGGAEFGVRGYVSAYNVADGKMAWRFYTVPGDPAKGPDGQPSDKPLKDLALPTWYGQWWKNGEGGGTAWDSFAYDPELDLLYVGVGNAAAWNRKLRSAGKGDNLFVSSILALKPETGEYVWHFQTTPGDEWDYTATQHMILADLKIDGKDRKVLMQAPKNGFFYVLDRATGEFISGKAYGAVTWATGLDEKGRPIEAPGARWASLDKTFAGAPGPNGFHNWHPMSFDPQTGLVYIPRVNAGFFYAGVDKNYKILPSVPSMGIDAAKTSMSEDPAARKAAREATTGSLVAWDPVAQKAVWTVEHPMAWNGGVLSTAGGLVFQGNAEGNFVAYDAKTGAKLWTFPAGTGIVAPPVTYTVNGEQYVTVLAGWGGSVALIAGEVVLNAATNHTNRVLTFKLGGKETLPVAPPISATLDPPPSTASKAVINQGRTIYARYCYACHGDGVVAGGETPDLRYSANIKDAAAFKSIVLDGALKENGMASFAGKLTEAQIESIRAYVVKRANDAKQQGLTGKP